jgi:hypothetical protein
MVIPSSINATLVITTQATTVSRIVPEPGAAPPTIKAVAVASTTNYLPMAVMTNAVRQRSSTNAAFVVVTTVHA